MDGATISNDTISQLQKQADAFDTALSDNRAAQYMQQGCKALKRTRQGDHKDQWQILQGQISAAFDLDQQVHLDAHQAALELADRKHEYGTAWQIINNIAGDVNKADPSKVRLQNDAIPNTKEELLEGWRFATE